MKDVQGNIFTSFLNEMQQPVEVKVAVGLPDHTGKRARIFYNELGHPINVEEAVIQNQQHNGMVQNNQMHGGAVPNNASAMAALMRNSSGNNTTNSPINAFGSPTSPGWNSNNVETYGVFL
jgi:hypothetical protein